MVEKLYAGIGSRRTPLHIRSVMTDFASVMYSRGWVLRSGGACGADQAFERGAHENTEIFKAEHATSEAVKLASSYHPAWGRCTKYVQKLHGRNAQIILGGMLDCPVRFTICWTADGRDTGGTGLGIRLSVSENIPVYNLKHDRILEVVSEFIRGGSTLAMTSFEFCR